VQGVDLDKIFRIDDRGPADAKEDGEPDVRVHSDSLGPDAGAGLDDLDKVLGQLSQSTRIKPEQVVYKDLRRFF
jgi:hypothetical protein